MQMSFSVVHRWWLYWVP